MYKFSFKTIQKKLLADISTPVYHKNDSYFTFKTIGKKYSNITDNEYKKIVSYGRRACIKGDVFQIVISRQFKQKFKGDEFNVYRALRSINPSSQIIVKNKLAFIVLITPQTSLKRIKMLSSITDYFLYIVSSNSTTGTSIGRNKCS